jgi:4-hydroxy-tetrahydrodipicolinate reductase
MSSTPVESTGVLILPPDENGTRGDAMKLLIVGYGKMGRLVDQLATDQGHVVAGRFDVGAGDWSTPADVAIDFTTAEALHANFPKYLERRLPVVIGTTGWADRAAEYRAAAEKAGLGVVASANFSIGVNLFQAIVAEAARLMAGQDQYGAWIHEAHHSAKRDAPSGTALLLRDAIVSAGFERPIDIASTRAGAIPGTHTIGFDSAADTIELTHTARDRQGFAAGAVLAARFVVGRQGWFSMADVLKG